jgi:hypothetical protein
MKIRVCLKYGEGTEWLVGMATTPAVPIQSALTLHCEGPNPDNVSSLRHT